MSKPVIALAAGGTGGHLFPAQALGEVLVRRGFSVHLVTDERVADYGRNFPADATHIVPSSTLTPSKPHMLPGQGLQLLSGVWAARSLFKRIKPGAVIGFGGYPSLTPLTASTWLGIPSAIHEANAVLGRANRLMVRRVDRIATSFDKVVGLPDNQRSKIVITGNPVRQQVVAEQGATYPHITDSTRLSLLIFGGSQGARFFSGFIPNVIEALPGELKKRITLTQQCRLEDIDEVRRLYTEQGLDFEIAPFFNDMPKRIAAAHLVIARAGASTVAELAVIGRPAVLVPLPHALDNDQLRNAEMVAAAGAGWLKPQGALDPQNFAQFLGSLLKRPDQLKAAAQAALAQGRADAAERLADMAVELSASPSA